MMAGRWESLLDILNPSRNLASGERVGEVAAVCAVMEKHGWENGESERAPVILQLDNAELYTFS